MKCRDEINVKPSASVDTVIFTVIDHHLHVLTVKRAHQPFKEMWSLVGGYIDLDKDADLEATAKRKLTEKTGVFTPYLEQFGAVGNNKRDPRGWSVTTIYFALIPSYEVQLRAGSGAADIKWSKIVAGKIAEPLAFDHDEILVHCMERLRSKVLYTSLPVHLMSKDFTLGELQKVYETILCKKIDHKSFRRRILNADFLEETSEYRHEGKRPAQLYRLKESHRTHIFVRNIEGAS
ncbi:MAG: NUDIX domain-containing protein [Pseudomonadota bacterium]|nr:NUDIX domain-containing protein [Pseudomonadota bacterium]